MSSSEQAALVALQEIDTSIDRQRHRRASLPQRDQLARIESELAAATGARDRLASVVGELAARQEQLEADLAGAEARIKEINLRLSSGQGGAGRDVVALTETVDHLRERVSALEDRILEAMDERAPHDQQLAALEEQITRLGNGRDTARAVLETEETAIDTEIASLAGARESAAGEVTAEHRAIYERLRSRLDGVAVSHLVGDRCDGCHLTLPATELDRIKRLPPETIVYCDQCGRILVRN